MLIFVNCPLALFSVLLFSYPILGQKVSLAKDARTNKRCFGGVLGENHLVLAQILNPNQFLHSPDPATSSIYECIFHNFLLAKNVHMGILIKILNKI